MKTYDELIPKFNEEPKQSKLFEDEDEETGSHNDKDR